MKHPGKKKMGVICAMSLLVVSIVTGVFCACDSALASSEISIKAQTAHSCCDTNEVSMPCETQLPANDQTFNSPSPQRFLVTPHSTPYHLALIPEVLRNRKTFKLADPEIHPPNLPVHLALQILQI